MRKVAWRLVPLLSLCFLLNILDRFNVAVAALTMNKTLGLSATTYGFGAGAFFWSYTLFQVPANLMLTRVGARRWLTAVIVAWSLCSMATALATGVTGFVLARFLLGMAEAGFLPGVVFLMTCWFPARFRGRAIGVFYAFGAFAGILIGPVSANLLRLDGWLGIAGWRWVFLLEGLPGLMLAAACPLVLRDRPADASWLQPRERRWLEDRLAAERAAATGAQLSATRAIMTPQVALLTLVALLGGCGFYAKSFFLPLILKTFDLGDTVIGYWLAVPQIAGILGMLLFSRSSDRSGERVWHLVAPMLIGAAGLLFAGVAVGVSAPLTVLAFTIASLGTSGALPVFWNLPTAFLGAAAAAGGIAFISAVANISGYVAPQLVGLLHDLSGSYRMPLVAMGVMVAIGGALVPLAAGLRPRRPAASEAGEEFRRRSAIRR